jgi:hypothetical protein
MFRTMRFLFLVTTFMSILMFGVGLANFLADIEPTEGYSIFDQFSIANANFSTPFCA